MRTTRKIAALLALCAITLQGLWPLLAQARPAVAVPICSFEAGGHSIEIPVGKSDAGGEHCKLCVLGADKAVLSSEEIFVLPAGKLERPLNEETPATKPSTVLHAHPRAPPAAS